MPATPEIPRPETPLVVEHQEEFIVPETLQQNTGVQVVQKNFKAQINDDHGMPLISTPPTQVITVTPPEVSAELENWAKGSVESSKTWLGAFWLRIIKKAIYFGWKIIGKEGGHAAV